jgi:hypothetical protein
MPRGEQIGLEAITASLGDSVTNDLALILTQRSTRAEQQFPRFAWNGGFKGGSLGQSASHRLLRQVAATPGLL